MPNLVATKSASAQTTFVCMHSARTKIISTNINNALTWVTLADSGGYNNEEHHQHHLAHYHNFHPPVDVSYEP